MIWAEFERAAPELAAIGRARIEAFRFVYVGTVRGDGGPRVNPVEAYLVGGHLTMNMMWRSLKALDLLRDPRVFVHSVVTSRSDNEGELKLRGLALPLDDAALREAVSDRFEREIGWRPPERSHFFSVAVESAAFVTYQDGDQHVVVWRPDRGTTRAVRPG